MVPENPREWAIWDAALDAAAALCDRGPGFSAWAGTMAKRKLDRQIAQAKGEGMRAAHAEMAGLIRLLRRDGSLGLKSDLERLIDDSERGRISSVTGLQLLDALRFADARLVEIEVRLPLGENSTPPLCSYHVSLTKRGRDFLEGGSAEGVAAGSEGEAEAPGGTR